MTETYRYVIDRVDGSEFEWQIFDCEKKGTPVVYTMFVVRTTGVFNFQAVLTSYDAIESASHEFPVFGPELWSTQFYTHESMIEYAMYDILQSVQDTNLDIDNPVQLAYLYGGPVRNMPIRIPAVPNLH